LAMSWCRWPAQAKAIQTLTSGKQIFDFGISQSALTGALGRDERHSNGIVFCRGFLCHLMLDGAEQEFLEAHAAQRRRSFHLAKYGIGHIDGRSHKIQISINAHRVCRMQTVSIILKE